MDSGGIEGVRAFLREIGALGIAVEGWGGEARFSGRVPDEGTLARLKENKAGILALFRELEGKAIRRCGLVCAPDVYPWELRIDWSRELPVWMGAWEREEGVAYACWLGLYGLTPETPEQAAFIDWIRWWVDARAALLVAALGVDAATARVMGAVDLVGWQFGMDRRKPFERCKHLQGLLKAVREDRREREAEALASAVESGRGG